MSTRIKELSRDEKSLLLYLETCVVDHAGAVDGRKMNQGDFEIVEKWNEVGFIKFGRICFKDISENRANWVFLSEPAWELAHKERRAKAGRMYEKRYYKTTAEKNSKGDD